MTPQADEKLLATTWFDGVQYVWLSDHTRIVAELQAEVAKLRADAERLDWLEMQHVEVRKLRRYGNASLSFCAQPDLEDTRSDIRAQIDKERP